MMQKRQKYLINIYVLHHQEDNKKNPSEQNKITGIRFYNDH